MTTSYGQMPTCRPHSREGLVGRQQTEIVQLQNKGEERLFDLRERCTGEMSHRTRQFSCGHRFTAAPRHDLPVRVDGVLASGGVAQVPRRHSHARSQRDGRPRVDCIVVHGCQQPRPQ